MTKVTGKFQIYKADFTVILINNAASHQVISNLTPTVTGPFTLFKNISNDERPAYTCRKIKLSNIHFVLTEHVFYYSELEHKS